MSNHMAGYMVSGIIEKILDYFNKDKISQEAARDLISASISEVLSFDGNDYECVEDIEGHYCGRCLKTQDKTYDFVRVLNDHYPEDLPLKGKEEKIYWEDSSHVFDGFCKECMDEWLEENIPEIPKEEYYKLMEKN